MNEDRCIKFEKKFSKLIIMLDTIESLLILALSIAYSVYAISRIVFACLLLIMAKKFIHLSLKVSILSLFQGGDTLQACHKLGSSDLRLLDLKFGHPAARLEFAHFLPALRVLAVQEQALAC